jgi:cytochrome b subunit of formate dehydrogenase
MASTSVASPTETEPQRGGLDGTGSAGGPRTRIEWRRFNAFHRWMHFLVYLSFSALVITGMPLKYKDASWAQGAMDAVGGVTAAGVYHRIAALITIAYWGLEMLFMLAVIVRSKGRGLRGGGSMMPGRKDLQDIIGMFSWFLGKGPKPQFDRYTYWEKFDFMSLAAGTVIIGLTGFVMWFPVWFSQYVPGVVINVSLVIHSNEALLAAGVIFIFVHFFSAHLKPESFPLDKVMFTGSIPLEHYKEERPLEYARRVREGTLDEVLVERRITWRTHLADVLWWTLTIIAGIVALLFAVFIVWTIFD